MGLAKDIADHLEASGITGSALGWIVKEAHRPPHPDQIVCVFQYAGGVPQARATLSTPGLQILVRGEPNDYDAAEAKIAEIFALLHETAELTLNGHVYVGCLAQQSHFLLEYDDNRRPVLAQNYIIWEQRG